MDEILKVLEREGVTSSQKLILVILKALQASEGVSFNEISYYSSLTRKTVISNLNALEEAGLVKVVRDSTRTNKYIVLV
ncbi:helix-turn-helix transcriptional regulator [Cytobacillus sp. Sa5YUA1]|uniref:Helix-turn-helix transcriptional regulator n=1 Tax=Cytobacillus stercorigallinarum TaxID=2762240 RepID=A0ABR8QK85_9BACI|nr:MULTISPECIES: helix-turn-helix domain-containing protein [Cytobacillus]MBD7935935.1 helix-turn-helix transcriptional regulator [Cytobacillus stercorigallinarum]MEA1853019.1 helix-turn-helix domain-containing protein [Cytobacillus sp. OWB-43]